MNLSLRSKLKTLLDFFRHPLILLIVGSVITSYLLPWILSEAAKNESNRKEKLVLAFKFLNKNSEVNKNFNSLLVALSLFHKYSTPEYVHEEQKELRKNSKDLYQRFNTDAWSWHWNLYEEAKIWNLLPKSDDLYITKVLMRYTHNWRTVMNKLSNFWDACLNPNYRCRDPKVTNLMNETRQEYNISFAARDSVIRYIISKLDIEQITSRK